jgi:cell division protein FtsQ
MPRVSRRAIRLPDRLGRWKLLLRRLRRLVRPAFFGASALGLVAGIGLLVRSAATPGRAAVGGLALPREQLAHISAALGWRVREVIVEGRSNTPEPLLRAAIGVSPGDPVLGFSVGDTQARIETLPWIESAAVERRLPGTVLVMLTERRPYAIWQSRGKFTLIDRSGQMLADQDVGAFKFLPLLVGAGAAEHAAELLEALARYPVLQTHMVAAVRVGDRRWNLCMQNGAEVLLPEGHAAAALQRLAALQEAHDLLGRPLQVIDIRLPDRMVLRPQPVQAAEAAAVAARSGPQAGNQASPPHGAAPTCKST